MIKRDRGIIFGNRGKSRGQQKIIAGVNPLRAMSNAPTQFGRSTQTRPVFGGRARPIRRR